VDPLTEQIALYLMYASVYLVPLAGAGVYFLIVNFVKPRLMSRRGCIKIYYLTPSGKLKHAYVKPELEAVHEIKDPVTGAMNNARGYSFTVAKQKRMFVDNLDYIVQDGPMRATFYDPEWNQMSLSKMQKMANPLSGRIIDSLMARVWNAARATLGKKEKNDIIIFIAIGIAAVAAAALAFQSYQEILVLKDQIAQISSRIVAGAIK